MFLKSIVNYAISSIKRRRTAPLESAAAAVRMVWGDASAIGEGKMRMTALEGIIEHGQVKLSGDVCLRENAKVYLLIADEATPIARAISPRLVHPEQLVDFQMKVTEGPLDARV